MPPADADGVPPADADLARIDAALVGLRRLWSHDTTIQDAQVGRVDLSTIWVVDALVRSGREHLSVAGLADALDVAHSTASRFVTRAEGVGVVQRARLADDSRQVTIRLTPSGAALAERARAFRLSVLQRAMTSWPHTDRHDLARLLTEFAHTVRHTLPHQGETP